MKRQAARRALDAREDEDATAREHLCEEGARVHLAAERRVAEHAPGPTEGVEGGHPSERSCREAGSDDRVQGIAKSQDLAT
jgi:hypothetical protein